jgi:hypothetical protein
VTDQTVTDTTPNTTTSETNGNTTAPGQTTGQNTTGTGTGPTQTVPCVQGLPTVVAPTCGNNASTQIAVVTQNCTSVASNSLNTQGGDIKIDISENGVPVDSKIVANSLCLNYAQIFQIVQQLCINCQLVVQNFYSSSTTNQTIANGWQGPIYLGYCMPKDRPVLRGDGTTGWLVILQPDADPIYRGATPAPYDAKLGYICAGTGSAPVPAAFTLTVPASLIGQFVNLCIQPSDPTAKPICHSVKIDGSASVTLPLSANLAVSVTKKPLALTKPLKPLSKKQLKALAARYSKLGRKTTVKTTTKAKAEIKKVVKR